MESGQEATAVRDSLALMRTVLANERTLLSYIRTGLGLVIAGIGALKFMPYGIRIWIGTSLILAGSACVAFGGRRYVLTNKRMARVRSGLGDLSREIESRLRGY